MSLALRTSLGCTEVVIDDDGGLKRFYQVADILCEALRVKFVSKKDDFDTINWDFQFHGHEITLHYNIYTGISIFPTKTREALKKTNRAVVELANVLKGKMLSFDMKKNIA